MRIAVLGGGITGLVTALQLTKKGHDATCFEAGARAGGLCQSEVVDGFTADRAGGHIIFSRDTEVLEFMLGLLEGNGYHTSTRQTCIYHRGRYVQYPFENGLGDLAKEETYLCLKDYVEAAFERRQGAEAPDDFEGWCLWRFGKGICELFMHPYNRKIWNIPLNELGTAWVRDRVPDAPMEDVIRSALGIRTEGYAHQSVFYYPLEGGFEGLIHGLVKRLPNGVLRTATPVTSLERGDDNWTVNGESYDRVISSVPLGALHPLLEALPKEVDQAFSALDSTSLMTVFLALDRSDPPPHSWLYFPNEEDGPQNRITWLSNYSPKNAPPGCSSIMAEVTYHGKPPASDADVTEQVVAGLSNAGFFRRDQLRFSRIWHNRYAYILYRHGLEECLDTIRGYASEIELDLVGRFGNYNYFNSDACIRAAFDLTESYPSV